MSRNYEETSHSSKEKSLYDAGISAAYVDADGERGVPHDEETHRGLKPRQISMIAIGGAIGTLGASLSKRDESY
jgi:amino acid permease